MSSSISFIVKINNQKAFRAYRTFDMLHFSVNTLYLFHPKHLHRNNSLLIPIIGLHDIVAAMIQLLVQFQGCKSGCDD
ncbi:hypothetical protein AP3564_11155 [Aeribacillus pallidus]|uniref:Uncharacterized protein n=2 Tax=Aeribacillus pallidus TaxID=33936 RepID=A0A223E602_9BACI|nr:hypothetical protein AP3564_11155 [Aeribacillus pallidus]